MFHINSHQYLLKDANSTIRSILWQKLLVSIFSGKTVLLDTFLSISREMINFRNTSKSSHIVSTAEIPPPTYPILIAPVLDGNIRCDDYVRYITLKSSMTSKITNPFPQCNGSSLPLTEVKVIYIMESLLYTVE